MENQKIIDEINSFCSTKYQVWLTGSIKYSILDEKYFFSEDRQKIAFIIKGSGKNLCGGTIGGIFYPFVCTTCIAQYILYIRDSETENIFLEIELDPNLNIEKILYISDTYDKFIILLKDGVLAGIIRTDKETYTEACARFSQILIDELREGYGTKKYNTISHDIVVNNISGQEYYIWRCY